MPELNAELVKRRAKELGADLVGIASAATLNAFPPDPCWPQTPERISPYCKSVIVVVQRIPAGAFRCKTNVPVQYIDMLVLRKMDKVAYRLAEELEEAGHPTFVTAAPKSLLLNIAAPPVCCAISSIVKRFWRSGSFGPEPSPLLPTSNAASVARPSAAIG